MKHEPRIDTYFSTIAPLRNLDFIDSLVDLLSAYNQILGIDGYTLSQAERPRYKPIEHDPIRRCLLEEQKTLLRFGGNKGSVFDFVMLIDDNAGKIGRNAYFQSSIYIHIRKSFFESHDQANRDDRIVQYLEFSEAIYNLAHPLCGETVDSVDEHAVHLSLDGGGLFRFLGLFYSAKHGRVRHPCIDCPVIGVGWANYYGPRCVRFWGRDLLLKARGAYQTKELLDGGIRILTAPHPMTPDDPEHRANQMALWKHLGLNPVPNQERIAKYKSEAPWEGAPVSLKMDGW